MRIIECLEKFIKKEIKYSDEYIEKALEVRKEYPEVADILSAISTDKMRHMQMLHGAVVKLIEDYRRTKGEPPAPMLAIYDFLHKEMIEDTKEVKLL